MDREYLKDIVREVLSNFQESDLIVKKTKKSWSEHKSELKDNINKLIDYIEKDVYYKEGGVEEITDVIDDTIEILKNWKRKVKSGVSKGDILDEN